MCGIVGYVGKSDAKEILISGLKALEYRGYDSSGIAYNANNKINIIKCEGKVSRLEEKINKNIQTNVGIGHTRWATHGAPTEVNAHPHKVGKTTLVHNGIIEDYVKLRKELSSIYEFKSDTDTEVAGALIDYLYNKEKDKLKALKKFMETVKGSYALAIMFDDELDSIYAIRKNSPLVLAETSSDRFIASDIAAILKYTNKYYLLDQGEIAKINHEALTIYNNHLEIIKKELHTYEGTQNDVMKNGFPHFMLKEIHDETTVYQNIINKYLPNYDILELEKSFGDFKKYQKINIIGCGSAYHAGLVSKYLFENYADVKTDVLMASEYRYQKIFYEKNELAIVISQSGETADTLEALKKAKENKCDTLGIINVLSSSIARESDKVIYCLAGCEIAVATTKAYLAQVLILNLISLLMTYQKGLITKDKANEYLKDLKNIINSTQKVLDQKETYHEMAKKIYQNEYMFFIGRCEDFALCMEGSLKMKEISYIHSESYAAGELKHGTISLIEKNTPVIGILTDESIADKTISNLKETKARGAKIIIVTNEKIYHKNEHDKFFDEKIIVDNANIFFQPLLIMTPIQLLAYYVAREKGENIDQPRNLAKSVTVE